MAQKPMKVQAALATAARGFPVFPIIPDSKYPAIKEWPQNATTDPATIKEWWKKNREYNIGIATGGDFFVVDADCKEGKQGLVSLDMMESLYDLPTSLRVVTPTGGIHVYLSKHKQTVLVSNADKIEGFPDVDIRAEGGFVMGPGSTIDGKPYEITNDNLSQSPPCIIDLLKTSTTAKSVDAHIPAIELDQPRNVEKMTDYLVNTAKEAVEGNAGSSATMDVARHLRDHGISQETAFDLMAEHWNETKASPPWQPDELETIINNAYRYAKLQPGARTAEGEFDVLDIEIGAPPSAVRDFRTTEPANENKTIAATPYRWIDSNSIPKRDWLLGRHFIRKFVSVTIAPGNIGKSSLLIVEALAMATGRNLLGQEISKPLSVWYWNLEDPYDELQRRIQAACQHYGINHNQLNNRLFVNSGRENELKTAITDQKGTRILRPVVAGFVNTMLENKIDVAIIDPFISSHSVSENDNPAIDMVVKEWGKIADKANASIELVHHTRKQGGDAEISTESARGGKSLTDAARDVRVLNRMTKEEGEKAGVHNHRLHFRTYSDKANMAPPADRSEWFKLESVDLANGDEVGVVGQWEWPDPFADVTADKVREVQDAVRGKNLRADARADEWVGKTIGEVMFLDVENTADKEKIKALLRDWLAAGWLTMSKYKDEKGKERPVVDAGKALTTREFEPDTPS